MNNFIVEVQNRQTGWEWQPAPLLANENSFGLTFNDEYIVPDITPFKNFFTWSNFRIFCQTTCDKINLWVRSHENPNQMDLLNRLHQSGDALSTYADYESLSDIFKNSDRIYFWIQATNKDANYTLTRSIYDYNMSAKAVTLRNISPNCDLTQIEHWLGWDPLIFPNGNGPYAHSVNSNSSESDVARWIMGWDNACVNVLTTVINPLIGDYQAAILDSYRMIDGLDGKNWLGCEFGRYIYGKILYCLEDHDSPENLIEGDLENYSILQTDGFKSFQLNISAIQY